MDAGGRRGRGAAATRGTSSAASDCGGPEQVRWGTGVGLEGWEIPGDADGSGLLWSLDPPGEDSTRKAIEALPV